LLRKSYVRFTPDTVEKGLALIGEQWFRQHLILDGGGLP